MAHGSIEWIEIPARDLHQSVRFYETVFGWKVNRGEHWEEYPMFVDAADHLGGGFVKSGTPAGNGGVLIYITVDEIESITPAIEKNGGTMVKPKTLIDESVGWWASFHDPAGNLVGLYQKKLKA